MKRLLIPIVLILVIVVFFIMNVQTDRNYQLNWFESFNEKSKMPYGLFVFHEELEKVFDGHKFRNVYYQPDSYLYANSEDGYGDFIAEGSYIKIGNTKELTDNSILELLYFVEKGNTLLLSDYYLPEMLADTLQLDVDYNSIETDSSVALGLYNRSLLREEIKIDRMGGVFYFGDFNQDSVEVLGYSKINKELPNFINVPFKEGNILLQLEPKIFTNYNMLKENRHAYAEAVISYLPQADIFFDSYLKYTQPYSSEIDADGDLSWFLKQRGFKWAWYLALFFTLLFVIFTAKRKQRIVPIIKPLENTTVGFIKTISNVYQESNDIKNMANKKIQYFLEHLRNSYSLDTSKINPEFIEKLIMKSGVKKEKVHKLMDYIVYLNSKEELMDIHLVRLNEFIEDFYS